MWWVDVLKAPGRITLLVQTSSLSIWPSLLAGRSLTICTLSLRCSMLRFMHHAVASCWALGVSSMAGYSMSRSSLIRLSISTFLYGRKSNVQWLGPCSDLCIALLLLVELPASPVWLVTLCHDLHSSGSQLAGLRLELTCTFLYGRKTNIQLLGLWWLAVGLSGLYTGWPFFPSTTGQCCRLMTNPAGSKPQSSTYHFLICDRRRSPLETSHLLNGSTSRCFHIYVSYMVISTSALADLRLVAF